MDTAPVSLNFYRRHGRGCAASRPANSMTSEPEERRRGFVKCGCPIYISGTLDGVFRRHATRQSDWEVARQIAAPFLAARSWVTAGDPLPPPPAPGPSGGVEAASALTPIAAAVDSFLDQLHADGAPQKTYEKYCTVLRGKGGLKSFAEQNGLRFIEEWKPKLIRALVASWPVAQSTRQTKLSIVKPFFEQFVEDEVIATNPARIRQRRNRTSSADTEAETRREPRLPFTDEEYRRQLEGCKTFGQTKRKWPKKKDGRQVVAISEHREYPRKVTGNDLADFIELSVNTGLRFMDVAKFNIDRLTPEGEVRLQAQKNRAWVCVAVSPYIQKMIRERARRHGPYIFGDPSGRKNHDIYLCWWRRLRELWAATGPWKANPTHHRFRHTFVRLLLQQNTSMSQVATLIGDTEETVRKHYANWVPELQQANTAILRKAVANFPTRG